MSDVTEPKEKALKGSRRLVADYRLPEVPCSKPPRIHPHYPTIRARHSDWVYRFIPPLYEGRLQRGIEQLDALYDSLVFPDGDMERVLSHTCLTTMVIDCDDLAQLKNALFNQIATEQANDPYSLAFANVWETFRKHAPSEAVYQRLRLAWRDWLDSVAEENRLRKTQQPPDVETLLKLRQTSSGLRPYFIAVEYILGIDAHEVTKEPDVILAIETGITHIALVNDLYSYRKEYAHEDSFNTIAALRQLHGYSLQDAIDLIYRRLDELNQTLVTQIDHLHRKFESHPLGPQLHGCFDAYHDLVAGNIQWHLETPRYNGHGYLWDGLRARHIRVDSLLGPIDPLQLEDKDV